jgi:hypothetical protein
MSAHAVAQQACYLNVYDINSITTELNMAISVTVARDLNPCSQIIRINVISLLHSKFRDNI